MKQLSLALALCLLTTTLPAAAPSSPSSPSFRAGAATANITPPLGSPIVGNFVAPTSVNIHDELHARCLVLDDGHTKLALVVLDLLGASQALCTDAKKAIEKEVGIPPQNVMISAVHTHSATLAGNGPFPFTQEVNSYPAFYVRRIVDGVKCAAARLRPAQLAFTTVDVPEHVFNRRWVMKPGTAPPNPFGEIDKVKMNPSSGSPDLVEPAGPTDPTVSILAFREPDGRPIAVFSAYSLHYVGGVVKGDISADYYGMYCRRLECLLHGDDLDPAPVAIMANGTSGDINSVDFRHPRPVEPPYAKMRRVADDLAAKVHAALAKAEYRDGVTLAACYREPTIERRLPTAEQIAWAKERMTRPGPEPGKVDLSYSYARRVLNMVGAEKTTPVPLQVLRIGPVCIGTMPGEPFAELGLAFRKRCPIQPGFLVELANGGFGYLPTSRHYELGGYETWLGSGHLEPHAGEKMLDTLVQMAAEIRPAAEARPK